MDTLTVRRHHARYRLPASRVGERVRLDRLLREVVETDLADALAAASVGVDEAVCIRTIGASVRLRLGVGDRLLVDAWREQVERSIRDALEAGGANVVRYPSRGHAFVDLAAGVVRGDLRRAWAWSRLGLWSAALDVSAEAAHREAVRALLGEAEMIVPTLVALANLGLARPFLVGVRDDLPRLARAALRVADGDPGVVASLAGGRPQDAAPALARGDDHNLPRPDQSRSDEAAAKRTLLHGPLGAAALAASPTVGGPERRALAALVTLAGDPGSVRTNWRARVLVDALTGAFDAAAGPWAGSWTAAADGETRPQPSHGDPERAPGASGDQPAVVPAGGMPVPVGDRDADTVDLLPVRARGRTAAGGVLFLLWIVADLGLPGELATVPSLGSHSVRWWLHQVAMVVAGLGPDDPAALAFAGLPPGARTPSETEGDPLLDDSAALAAIVDRVAGELASRLGAVNVEGPRTLADVCGRSAEIVADPGWIEAQFDLAAVNLDLRRAGLDLDPGYLPWLGTVVRFRYA